MSNFKDDIDKYAGMWDKALQDGLFKDAPGPVVPQTPDPERDPDFFGVYPTISQDLPLNECDTKYWNLIYRRSNNQGDAPDPIKEIIKEEHKPKGRVVKEEQKKMDNPNPVMPWTKGMDQDMHVTKDFSDGKNLTELANLKLELQKLEDKMNSDDGLGKSVNKYQKQIESMWDRINKLSDDIQGNDDADKN